MPFFVVLAGAAALTFGCRFLVGSLDECTTDAECASRGSGLVCRGSLCVAQNDGALDARCTPIGPAEGEGGEAVTLGALLPLTDGDGGAGQWGPFWRNAIEVTITELNPPLRRGIRGRPLRVLMCDTAGDPNRAAALAKDLVARGVPAILSDGSTETIAIASVTVPANVLLMAGASTSPEITHLPATGPRGLRMVWRTTPSDTFQGRVIAQVLARGGGDAGAEAGPDAALPRVGAFERDDPYGQGLWGAFQSAYPGEKKAFLFPVAGDVSSALAAERALAPDVALVIAFPDEVVSIVNAASSAPPPAMPPKWFFTQGAKFPALFSKLKNPAFIEGARGTSPSQGDPTSVAYQWIASQVQGKYGTDPKSIVDMTNVFDATMLLAIAAYWAGDPSRKLDGPTMAEALTHVSAAGVGTPVPLDPPDFNDAVDRLGKGTDIDVEGASGHLDFDPATGEAPSNIEVWQVVDGAFQTLEIAAP